MVYCTPLSCDLIMHKCVTSGLLCLPAEEVALTHDDLKENEQFTPKSGLVCYVIFSE